MKTIKKIFKSPIFLISISLLIGIGLISASYYISTIRKAKQKEIEVMQISPSEACSLSFSVEHDSSVPDVECQKLVNGVIATPDTNAVSVQKGQTFKYTLKLINSSTTEDYEIETFVDEFISDNIGKIELKSITIKPDGITCNIGKTIGNQYDQVNCDFRNYILAKGTTLLVEVEALALENTTTPIDNRFHTNVVKKINGAWSSTVNIDCPAFVQVVPKVYTALSCEKVLTPKTAKIGDTVTTKVNIKTRVVVSESQLKAGEVMIDQLPASMTFVVNDPLYLVTELGNTNSSWLEGAVIDTLFNNCNLVTETGGKSVNCNYTNYNVTANQGLVLPFTATIGANSLVGQSIKNVIKVTAENKTAICSDIIAIVETPTQAVSCTKTFLDANENVIANGTKIKQGSRLISRITITNTGNTTLDNLSVHDPLSGTYSAQGASNLGYLTFKEMRNGTPAQITNRCTFSNNMRDFSCNYADSEAKDPIVVAVGTPLNIDTIVEVNSDVKLDSKIVNIAKVFDTTNPSLVAYCNDDIIGTVKDTPPTPVLKHTECQNQACVEVDGEGDSTCTNDRQCSYGTCENESCKLQTCENGDCKTICVDDVDCREATETHLSCQNQSCVVVSGAGSNQCATNTDCTVLSSTAPIAQVPDTGTFERTIAITVFASALIFLGIALSVL